LPDKLFICSTDGYLRAVQDGPFEVNVKQISAVNDPQTFASSSPVISLSSTYEIKTLIDRTIHSLYDKGYQELCIKI